jgi:hypothetical protein
LPRYAWVVGFISLEQTSSDFNKTRTSREKVCSRLIKPTTQAYLGNVRLLTRPITCGIFWPNTCSISGGKAQHCPRACSSDTILKSLEPYSFPKGTSKENVCSRLIKPTTQAYLGNVRLLTIFT